MAKELRMRVLALLLAILTGGQLGAVLAQTPVQPAKKAVGSSTSSTPAGNDGAAASAGTVASSSSNPKGAASGSGPSSTGGNVPSESKTQTTPAPKVDANYIVGIADSLLISVWKEPDFSGPVVVRPDGIITVPVVGDVRVVGLTTGQVQDILTEKLKTVVTEPQVTVIVRDIKSRKVYLVGKVGRPGAVALGGHETVLQILAEAGGPAQYAKPQKIYILRTVGDHQKRIQFNYKKVLAGSEPDLELEIGDVIVVP